MKINIILNIIMPYLVHISLSGLFICEFGQYILILMREAKNSRANFVCGLLV